MNEKLRTTQLAKKPGLGLQWVFARPCYRELA